MEVSTSSAGLRRFAAAFAIALAAGLAPGARADDSLADGIAAAVASGAREFVVPTGTHILQRGLTLRGVTNFTLRGEPGAVLSLPPAAVAVTHAATPAGGRVIPVSRSRALRDGMRIEIAAPGEIEPFTGRPRPVFQARLERVEADRLLLSEPLPHPVPAGTILRDAEAPNLVSVLGGDRIAIEGLELDGGRLAGDPPIQGHARLCAIFAEGPYTYEKGPTGPPVRRLTVRNCTIRNCFGRGVAGYAIEDAVVDSCTITGCSDEGIDFDHFAVRCRAESNRVSGCRIGIEMNDASGCRVAFNEITACGMGLNLWPWCKQPGLNSGNVIESNRFSHIAGDAIRLASGTSGNVVRANSIGTAGGFGISVAGKDQTLAGNRVDPGASRGIEVREGPHRIGRAGVANLRLILAPILGIAVLLVLILRLKVQAFIALLIASILVGLVAGMDPAALLTSMQNGMGGTLGFVATVVGLGAILGQILESSGGAEAMALTLVRRFGEKRAPWALMLAGFIIAIPVFFDVGFIILVPVLYALAAKSGRSLLYYGIPLLAGLAVTHSFVPPTPGPVAVAEIVGADLGWVILLGIVAGLPTAIVAGPLFGSYISRRIVVQAPAHALESLQTRPSGTQSLPSFGMVALIMGAPLVLILGSTASQLLVKKGIVAASAWTQAAAFAGHPFTALLVSTLLALYLLGVRRGFGRAELMELSSKALAPAGIIILITGAGGVLKQVLIDSGIGKILAEAMSHGNLPPILLAWLLAVAVRIAQGSSTVAMITAAGIVAPMIANAGLSDAHLGLVVISIASGATILSHVNDSGFWLVGKYFGLSEKQTLQSWTVMETLIAFCGLAFTLLLSWIL